MSVHRTVVIAIDDSFHSEFAFDFYVKNVHREGDRIVLVHVPEYSNVLSTSSLLTDPNIVSDLLKDNEERVSDLVEKYSMKMKECNVRLHLPVTWSRQAAVRETRGSYCRGCKRRRGINVDTGNQRNGFD
ncbi:uncharacterized protein LOC128545874 isoform X3 [Mercenaria mercenaria]|uniref:uncharacterized protein LOC128545874 isoform X3 n=1 Tax=Mercenaria mercenaria TaxID=6596 RepID=UPI00234EFE4C|nr:uncharacterized protein LOC128545874 isoform X3 [Mercenaria mercenaria]